MNKLARFLTRASRNSAWKVLTLAVMVATCLCCPWAGAQSGAGMIQGTVKDATGAVIPSAGITVTNHATNVKISTKSNNVGFYQVPGLFTGSYTVSVTAPDMKTYNRVIDLLAGQTAVINPVMTAGTVTQQVTVAANAIQLVDKANGTITTTLDNARINQLPMNGRNLISLVQETTPGLNSCSQSASCPNGLFGEAMEYVADGASMANREFGGTHTGSAEMLDPDSVQQVHVVTSGSSARYATPATAVLTTKSGTNQLHGTFFETARNSGFGIARQRQNPSNFSAPPYIRNEFGASAGGPIIIPRLYHGRDKSFWFFAYERYSLRSFSYQPMRVPSAKMRKGDFSELNELSTPVQLYDPATTQYSADCNGSGAANDWCRTPFSGNQIDSNREVEDAKIFNDITAPPTNTNNPYVTSNLDGQNVHNVTAPKITFRLDHVFNQNNRAYLRYTQGPTSTYFNRTSSAQPTVAADGLPYAASNLSLNLDDLFSGAIGFTHVFSPTFFSETVLSQTWFGEFNSAGGTPFHNFEKELGLPNNFGAAGFPQISGNIISPMQGTMFMYSTTSIVSDIDENLTKTEGKHQLEFGFRYRHERFGARPDQSKDTVDFGGNGTALEDPSSGSNYKAVSHTGRGDADEFLGNAASYSVHLQPPYQHLHDMEFDAYLQDNYHLSSNFTLNLGLRYEAHPAMWSKYGMMMSFDLKNDAIVLAATPAKLIAEGLTTQALINNDLNNGVKFETPAEAGMPATTLTNNYNFTFGPRVGFAWQLPIKWKTVMRGAYGRYIYPEPIRSYAIGINRNTPFVASYGTNYNSAAQAPDSLANYQLRTVLSASNPWVPSPAPGTGSGIPITGVNSADVIDSTSTNAELPGYGISSIDPHFPPDYVNQVNFGLEQPLPGNSVLRVSYLYTNANNLGQLYYYNEHYSTYAWEVKTGTKTPSGSTIGLPDYSRTGLGVYDQTTYGGGSNMQTKSGWSNDNILQMNYQRLFHHGFAYQITYNWQKPMRVGGNGFRDSNFFPSQVFVNSGLGTVTPTAGTNMGVGFTPPPPRPAGIPSYAPYHALNRYENYIQDTAIPTQQIKFNGIVDLPFGRGKRFLSGANRALNELVGGWQLAGAGIIHSQNFTVNNGDWGPTGKLHIYKHGKPIVDCTSGNCYKEYLWFNGYIPKTQISGNPCAANSGSKVITGLPADYQPAFQPIDTVCSDTTHDKYFGTNDVNITLADGTLLQHVTYQPSPSGRSLGYIGNPYSHTVLNGPFNYSADLSLFKVFPITERVRLRFNMDTFNAFNVQGFTNPSSTSGIEKVLPGGNAGAKSYNGPRQIQLTLRLTF